MFVVLVLSFFLGFSEGREQGLSNKYLLYADTIRDVNLALTSLLQSTVAF
jgi:hypothetical protein